MTYYQKSLFLDDKKENIEAAIDANINGIVYDYNNHENMLAELDRYEVNYNQYLQIYIKLL